MKGKFESARRVRHEGRQRLQQAAAVSVVSDNM
jgi:hypothetical protein